MRRQPSQRLKELLRLNGPQEYHVRVENTNTVLKTAITHTYSVGTHSLTLV